MGKSKNVVVEKSFDLALHVIDFSKKLRNNKEHDLASQLFRCGTSVGANIREAQNAESKADFIHKMKVSAKECEESIYWLELCEKSTHLISDSALLDKAIEVKKILNAIIGTSKRK